ncbi:MAG: hypothetical protein RI956_872 [Pseudomonadota bacterium]|jgi:hypothetical protein
MKSKKKYLPALLKNSKLLSGLTSALTAVLLTTVPVQAEEAATPVYSPNNLSITESAATYLNFNDKQGADGTDWVWRHQVILNNIVKCPLTVVGNCYSHRPGQFIFADTSVQNVFSVTPLNGFYDTEKKRIMRFKIENPDFFVENNKRKFLNVLPYIILKPGEYAIPTIIALDKWIPVGRGKVKNGVFKSNEPKFGEVKFNGQIGTWEGHAFRGHRIHVCVNRTGLVPKMGDEVTCNAPAKIPKGVVP